MVTKNLHLKKDGMYIVSAVMTWAFDIIFHVDSKTALIY